MLTNKVIVRKKMLYDSFAEGNHYLCAAVSLPTMIPATIVDMINCSWLNRRLEKYMHNLNRHLTVINFCSPPTKTLDYKHYQNMSTRLASVQREKHLGQDVHHSKPKTIESLIKGRQPILG